MMTIDFMTATPKDVIARSILMHDSMLASHLRDSASVHRNYAKHPTHADPKVPGIAREMADACETAAAYVESGDIGKIMKKMKLWVPTLNLACRLQAVPMNIQKDIAGRSFS